MRLDGWQNIAASRTLTLGDGSAMTTPFADASELQLDPRLGALFHVTREVALRASVYRAFRAPTLNELYRPFQVGTVLTAANDRLRPETLWGGELGTQIVLDGLAVAGHRVLEPAERSDRQRDARDADRRRDPRAPEPRAARGSSASIST